MQIKNFHQETVVSLHAPEKVYVSGFEFADSDSHMIEWIRKGRDFRQFVVNDIEVELYTQDASAQLLSVECKARPKIETKVRQEGSAARVIVTQMLLDFPITLRVQSTNGEVWKLDVNHSYHATNMDVPEKFHLRLDFTILGHQVEIPNELGSD
ncbi:hypothetical protein ACTSKR_05515 [Chitinibacteraceae bacterium HSL-7]